MKTCKNLLENYDVDYEMLCTTQIVNIFKVFILEFPILTCFLLTQHY